MNLARWLLSTMAALLGGLLFISFLLLYFGNTAIYLDSHISARLLAAHAAGFAIAAFLALGCRKHR